ncbi:hypothetical protein ACSBR1_018413 [Camellia fascicularis]
MSGYNYMNRVNTDDRNKAKYSSESYVTSREKIVEHIRTPVVVTTEYQHRSVVTRLEPLKDYGVTTTDKWPSPFSPILDRPQVMVTEYGYTSPTKAEPWNNYGVTNDQWPSSPVHDRPQVGLRYSSPPKAEPVKDYGVTNDKWRPPSSPVYDRPQVGLRYSSPPSAEPVKDYGVTNDKWRRPSSPVNDRPQVGLGYSSPPKAEPLKDYEVPDEKWRWPSNPVYDRPQVGLNYSSPTKVEPLKDYEVTDDKWRRPSNPVRDGPQVMATEYVYNSPTKVEPRNNYGVTNDKWQRPSGPVQEYGYDSPTKVKPVKDYGVTNNPILDRSQKVEEFDTRAQPEASRPTRPGLQIATNWRNNNNTPKSMGQGGYADYTNNNNNNDWNKPSGNTIRDESLAGPFIANRDEREKLGRNGTPLSEPTNDIGKAVEILKEAAKARPVPASAPAAPQPRMTVLASKVPKSDTYKETIDSREAQRRYGKPNQPSRPFQAGETYTGTIDSIEAARKFNGVRIP